MLGTEDGTLTPSVRGAQGGGREAVREQTRKSQPGVTCAQSRGVCAGGHGGGGGHGDLVGRNVRAESGQREEGDVSWVLRHKEKFGGREFYAGEQRGQRRLVTEKLRWGRAQGEPAVGRKRGTKTLVLGWGQVLWGL